MSNSRYILILAIIISSCSIKNYRHTPPIVERPSEIIKRVNDSKKRFGGTIASSLFAMMQGVQVLRIHDVNEIIQGVKVFKELLKN